jgi:hypothetical protein
LNKAIPKGNTMHFTPETSSNGVIERHFIVDEITGVLWSPTSGTVGAPLLLAGHSGGMHKKAPGLVARALHSVTTYGFTVAAIDAPEHGDRPRNLQDQQWAEASNRRSSTAFADDIGGPINRAAARSIAFSDMERKRRLKATDFASLIRRSLRWFRYRCQCQQPARNRLSVRILFITSSAATL